MISKEMLNLFEKHNGILNSKKIHSSGLDPSSFRKAYARGDIERYSRGIYYLNDLYYDDHYLLQLRYSKGVYSHETAAFMHQLTTNPPFYFYLSFPTGYHLKNAEEENIIAYHKNNKILSEVTVVHTFDSNPIKVTNKERTIVDMIKSKYSMPSDVEEIIDNYLYDSDKDLDRLYAYGKESKLLESLDNLGFSHF